MVVRGDATALTELVPGALRGQVALVVTSPPYGPTVHGHVRPGAHGVAKRHNRYGEDKGNLAYRDLPGLADGFTGILRGCATLLRPGGMVVVTAPAMAQERRTRRPALRGHRGWRRRRPHPARAVRRAPRRRPR